MEGSWLPSILCATGGSDDILDIYTVRTCPLGEAVILTAADGGMIALVYRESFQDFPEPPMPRSLMCFTGPPK
jgi:hypothetical protein